jgi:hypothetical protein
MTLLPNGRTERAVLDDERAAAREFQRLTDLYLARARDLYPRLSRSTKLRVTPTLQQLRSLVAPGALPR